MAEEYGGLCVNWNSPSIQWLKILLKSQDSFLDEQLIVWKNLLVQLGIFLNLQVSNVTHL